MACLPSEDVEGMVGALEAAALCFSDMAGAEEAAYEAAYVLERHPAVLRVAERDVVRRLTMLKDLDVGQGAGLWSVVRSFPGLLTADTARIEEAAEFLKVKAGVQNVGRFITRAPAVLTVGYEDLEEKVSAS